MMNNKDFIFTLDDGKKYALIKKMTYDNKNYIYLVDVDDYKNIIVGELDNDSITVVKDVELFGKLILEFSKID